MQKLLSIIIPTYNSAKTLQRTINSIIQLKTISEVIIIDGGSSDETLSIIEKNKDIIDLVVSKKDNGIYDAMNKGIELSNGKFILFLGSDDQLLISPAILEKLLIDTNVNYYGKALFSNGVIYGTNYTDRDLSRKNICHQSIFYSRENLKKTKFNLKYTYMADYELNLRKWKKERFIYIDHIISEYYIHGASSTNIDYVFKKDSIMIFYKAFGIKGLFYKLLNFLEK